jgi:membrane complex biogenesis BtpA family protein
MTSPTPYGGLDAEFWSRRPLVGMVHLGALPGSVRAREPLETILERAVADARSLVDGGVDALMVENFFDAPFSKGMVPPITVASLTRAVLVVREAAGEVPVGVNCLRNDGVSALSIAHATGARFVRVNVYVGAAVTDQGIVEGLAREVQLARRHLGADVAVWADVFVKHASQIGDGTQTLADAAKDAVARGLADAVVVSGAATGAATPLGLVREAKDAVPGTPVLVGSGFSAETALDLLAAGATGAIVGSSLKQGGRIDAPVDVERVRRLVAAVRG